MTLLGFLKGGGHEFKGFRNLRFLNLVQGTPLLLYYKLLQAQGTSRMNLALDRKTWRTELKVCDNDTPEAQHPDRSIFVRLDYLLVRTQSAYLGAVSMQRHNALVVCGTTLTLAEIGIWQKPFLIRRQFGNGIKTQPFPPPPQQASCASSETSTVFPARKCCLVKSAVI